MHETRELVIFHKYDILDGFEISGIGNRLLEKCRLSISRPHRIGNPRSVSPAIADLNIVQFEKIFFEKVYGY